MSSTLRQGRWGGGWPRRGVPCWASCWVPPVLAATQIVVATVNNAHMHRNAAPDAACRAPQPGIRVMWITLEEGVPRQRVRDEGGPAIAGQLLPTPVTDCDFTRPSHLENAEGDVLTLPLMHWFFDHHGDVADRADPRVAPQRARSLAGLPPAMSLISGRRPRPCP